MRKRSLIALVAGAYLVLSGTGNASEAANASQSDGQAETAGSTQSDPAATPQTEGATATQPEDAAASTGPSEDAQQEVHHVRWFPPRLYAGGVFYLPKVTYSDSRGLGLGGDAIFPFRWPGSQAELPASELRLKGRITMKGQTQADVQAVVYPNDDFGLKVRVAHETLSERFYGFGPNAPEDAEEEYRPSHLDAYVEVFRDVWKDIRLGARFELERVDLLETEPGGALAVGDIRGSEDGENAIGTGLVLDWDRRDSRYFPRRGFYLQSFALFFDEDIGSNYDFNNYHLDARGYLSPTPTHVLALQFFTFVAKGEPPFWHFAELGGRAHSRGFRRGRYRDRMLVAAQAEYRVRFLWRIGAAGFFGVADVASTAEKMQLEYMKANFGGGPRLFLGDPGREITVRFDVGFGGNVPRYYFSLGEAF